MSIDNRGKLLTKRFIAVPPLMQSSFPGQHTVSSLWGVPLAYSGVNFCPCCNIFNVKALLLEMNLEPLFDTGGRSCPPATICRFPAPGFFAFRRYELSNGVDNSLQEIETAYLFLSPYFCWISTILFLGLKLVGPWKTSAACSNDTFKGTEFSSSKAASFVRLALS